MGWFDSWIAYSVLRRRMTRYEERLRRLEYKMATFEEVVSDLATVTDSIAERIEAAERTNAALREAVQAGDNARAAALAQQSEQHAAALQASVEKLRGLGADASNPVPDATPVDPAPVDNAPTAPEVPSTVEDGTPVTVTEPETAPEAPVQEPLPGVDGQTQGPNPGENTLSQG